MQKIAIVGAATLKGKELKEVLEERNYSSIEVRLLDDDEALGVLESVNDEATFIQAVDRHSFEDIDLAFFACDEAFTRKHWKLAQDAGCAIVDMSYAMENDDKLKVRAPWIERELEPQGEAAKFDLETTAVVVAHSAAVMLALLLKRASFAGRIRNTVATVFEPVSEYGNRGMDELHQQTLNLLSFQPLPKDMFDMQIAFNMLSRFGEESKVSLETVASRVLRHFQQITHSRVPVPAIQVLQAPAFHSHTISIYVEAEQPLSAKSLAEALQGDHVSILDEGEDGPSNVTAAGQDEILVALRQDTAKDNGCWIWAAADNLKLSAITALDCGSTLAAARPSGKIQ